MAFFEYDIYLKWYFSASNRAWLSQCVLCDVEIGSETIEKPHEDAPENDLKSFREAYFLNSLIACCLCATLDSTSL